MHWMGFIDLRPDNPDAGDPEVRRLAIGRLQRLERMGLATGAGPGEWIVGLDAERSLRDLGLRGDVIKTMHRAFTDRGQDRARMTWRGQPFGRRSRGVAQYQPTRDKKFCLFNEITRCCIMSPSCSNPTKAGR